MKVNNMLKKKKKKKKKRNNHEMINQIFVILLEWIKF